MNIIKIFISIIIYFTVFNSYGQIHQFKSKEEIHDYYSDISIYQKNPVDAIATLRKGITGSPGLDADIFYKIGVRKQNLGDNRGAIMEYSNAINNYISRLKIPKPKLGVDSEYLEFNAMRSYINRALAREEIKDYVGAVDDYYRIIEMGQANNHISYNKIGFIKIELKDFKGAMISFDATLRKELGNEDEASAHYGKGICLIKLGQKEIGCLELSKAGEQGQKWAYETIRKLCN